MSNYGRQSAVWEWCKLIIYKVGSRFGFSSSIMSLIIGMLLMIFSWVVIPGMPEVIRGIPIIANLLSDVLLHQVTLGASIIGTIGAFCCWMRICVNTRPDVFDRYKIKVRLPVE